LIVPLNREPTAVAVLMREGKSLLDAHRDRSGDREPQTFHAGLVKPRELAHDAQLYRLFQAEATRIEAEGGRVDRVLLDYELKREYGAALAGRLPASTGSRVSTHARPIGYRRR
jgi:hypothetical protein